MAGVEMWVGGWVGGCVREPGLKGLCVKPLNR